MQIGDLVKLKWHTKTSASRTTSELPAVGVIIDVKFNQKDRIDSMFPYHVYFSDKAYTDWFGSASLELASEAG